MYLNVPNSVFTQQYHKIIVCFTYVDVTNPVTMAICIGS